MGFGKISKVSVAEGDSISEHIKHFQSILGDKLEVIEKLKQYYGFECDFDVLGSIPNTLVMGLIWMKREPSFINKISNRFTCSIIAIQGSLT